MSLIKWKLALLLALTVTFLGAGLGMLGYHGLAAEPPAAPVLTNPAPEPTKANPGPTGLTRARTFQSTLSLLVFEMAEGAPPRVLGMTGFPGTKPISIPANALWYVQPMPPFGGFGAIGGGFNGGGLGPLNKGMAGGLNIGLPIGGGFNLGGLNLGGNFGGGALGLPNGGKRPNGKKPPLKKPAVAFGNELTGDSLKALVAEMRKHNVPGLALGFMQISDTDIAKLAAVSSLQMLLLDNSKIDNAVLPKLKEFRSLRMLSLENTPITDDGLKAIKEIKALSRLHLSGKSITNEGLATIRDATGLTWLRLNGVGVDGDGLASLKSLPHLTTLEIAGGIRDTDLKGLKDLPQLKKLRLHKTKITDDGLKMLKDLKGLESLSIDGHWGLDGVLPSISFKQGKVEWLFNGNLMGLGAGVAAGVGGLGGVGAPGGLPPGIKKAPEPQFTAQGIAQLADLPKLVELSVSNTKFTDNDVEMLTKFTGLRRLGLFAPSVTDKGLVGLKALTKLEAIDLRGTQATAATATVLRSATGLKSVKNNLVFLDPEYKSKLSAWKKALPRATIRPLVDMNQNGLGIGGGILGGFGGGALGLPGGFGQGGGALGLPGGLGVPPPKKP